jgi:transposase
MDMRYITNIDEETIKELEKIMKEDERYKSRHRAHAILLSNQGKTINELAEIFGCQIRTIYRWFDRFEADKIEGIFELKGRGRKPKLTIEKDAEKVIKHIKKNSL